MFNFGGSKMNIKKRCSRFVAKILVFTMIIQGMPFSQISQTYTWEPDRQKIQRIVDGITFGFSMLFSPVRAHAGTPHTSGNYTINRIPKNFIDISGYGIKLQLGDEGGISGIPIGFNFEFYGNFNTTISITANGYLSFDTQITSENRMIPLTDIPNNLIAPFWDDLNPEHNADSAIYFTTLGTAPERVFIVQWQDIPLSSDPDSRLTFEVLLFEENNEIQFQYAAMTDGSSTSFSGSASGSSATIGIENDDGSKGNQLAFNKVGAVSTGDAWSFTLDGTAFEQGRLAGDLDDDAEDTILDQSLLTRTIATETVPRTALNLLLSDIWPSPGDNGRAFGDGSIDANDHDLLFEVIMNRANLHPLLWSSSFFAALPGEVLTLYGTGFDPTGNNNSVVFIDTDGNETITAAEWVNPEGTELNVTVPGGMGYIIDIRISRNGLPSNPLTFVMENQPLITEITPDRADIGDTVHIRGFQFNDVPDENNVSFNGIPATVNAVLFEGDSEILMVTIPAGTESGPVTVTVAGVTSNEVYFSMRESLQAAITTPETDTEITAPVDIIGTAWDEFLDYYVLEYAPVGTNNFTEFARGTDVVEEGVLGTFDPTLLENGIYTVKLTVFNQIGQFQSIEIPYFVTGDFKIGLFSVSFNDLEIPLAGIPIQVIRGYDTRRRFNEGDFGYGWTLSVKSYPKIQKNRPEGESWNQTYHPGHGYSYYALEGLESHAISVTLANGRTLEFDFAPSPNFQAIYPLQFTKAAYTARPGTSATIEPVGDTDLVVCGDGLCTYDMFIYDPQKFKVTLEDGTVYEIDVTEGLSAVEDTNGNELTFTADGIFHSSGESIGFTRDAEGRITTVTDPAGNDITYLYDANGDLTGVTNRNNKTTTFTYLQDHYLDEIKDPLGRPVSKNEYDASGRLVAIIDAEGKRIDYDHDINARQEIIEDRLGYITIYEYDDEGNVVAKTDHLGHRWTYTYNSLGYKTSQTDPLGNTSTFTHDDKGHVLTTTGPLGNTTTYTYDAQGHILTEIDPLNHVTANTYDAAGNLVQVTDPTGGSITYTYGDKGLKTSQTSSPDGILFYTTTYEYDTRGNLIKEIDPLGHETHFEYDTLSRQTKVTKTRTTSSGPVPVITEFTYDGEGNILTETLANGAVRTYEYDALGNKTAAIDPLGRRTEYTYEARGNLIGTTAPDGRMTASLFDFENRLVSSTDRAGNVTHNTYNFSDHLIKTTYPDNTFIENTYDEADRLVKIRNPNGAETRYEYDGAGRLTKLTDSLLNTVIYEYDAAGRRSKMIDSLARETQYEYDFMGRSTRTTFSNGTIQQTTYDLLGRKTSETDQAGNTTQYEYDAMGQLIAVIDALGQTTSYAYDELGNKIRQTDANNHVTLWAYDNVGNLLSRTLPMGMSEHFTYDLAGNLESETDFNGATTHYTYDELNRLVLKTFTDNSSVSYTYTVTGKRASVTDANGTASYIYDIRNRLTTLSNPDGSSLIYTYDAAGNRLATTVQSGTTTTSSLVHEYDTLNRLIKVTDTNSGITSYEYDAIGNRTKMTYPNGVEARYTYDNLNRLVTLENVAPDNSTLSSYTYTLGASGNRLQVVENSGRTVDYAYDGIYRLTEESITNDPSGVTDTITYTYDAFGNRLTKMDSAGTIFYVYDANDRLTSETGAGFTRNYTYDSNGNRTGANDSTESKSFTFDFEDRMTAIQTTTSQSTYTYDDDGLRIGEDVDGIFKRYIFDKNRRFGKVLEERQSDGTVSARYTWGNTLDPICMERDGTVSHYLADGNLNIRVLVNDATAITDTYDLDAFGNILHSTGSTENSYLLHGQYYDANSGFYYLRARWMDPKNGTFISVDPAVGSPFEPQSLHKYVFAANNPLTKYDPTGLFTMVELMSTVNIAGILSLVSLPVFFGLMSWVFIEFILCTGFKLRHTAVKLLNGIATDFTPPAKLYHSTGNDPISLSIKIASLGNDIIRIGALSLELADSLKNTFGAFQGLASSMKNGLEGKYQSAADGGSGAVKTLKKELDNMKKIGKKLDGLVNRIAVEIRYDAEEKPITKVNRMKKPAGGFKVQAEQWKKVSETCMDISAQLPW